MDRKEEMIKPKETCKSSSIKYLKLRKMSSNRNSFCTIVKNLNAKLMNESKDTGALRNSTHAERTLARDSFSRYVSGSVTLMRKLVSNRLISPLIVWRGFDKSPFSPMTPFKSSRLIKDLSRPGDDSSPLMASVILKIHQTPNSLQTKPELLYLLGLKAMQAMNNKTK